MFLVDFVTQTSIKFQSSANLLCSSFQTLNMDLTWKCLQTKLFISNISSKYAPKRLVCHTTLSAKNSSASGGLRLPDHLPSFLLPQNLKLGLAWANFGKQMEMNLMNENGREEDTIGQVQQRKKICCPFLIGYKARWGESCWSLVKRRCNQIPEKFAGCWNFKTSKVSAGNLENKTRRNRQPIERGGGCTTCFIIEISILVFYNCHHYLYYLIIPFP